MSGSLAVKWNQNSRPHYWLSSLFVNFKNDLIGQINENS